MAVVMMMMNCGEKKEAVPWTRLEPAASVCQLWHALTIQLPRRAAANCARGPGPGATGCLETSLRNITYHPIWR
jgi:hypothetical protein